MKLCYQRRIKSFVSSIIPKNWKFLILIAEIVLIAYVYSAGPYQHVCMCIYHTITYQLAGLQCTVGHRGEPTLDSAGRVEKCRRSADCSLGSVCDPNLRVCCKGSNRECGGHVVDVHVRAQAVPRTTWRPGSAASRTRLVRA